ncbi:uncharacterized protein LOC107494552 [Arachis duranensis]|uniref:Uncharacterized protein LOC107494552 n=1 Tax=Arachis duranensis TaxID=130453 RepID=A0A6P4DRF1_ARADU|nr:uncharacterized protein LOC107494552 [Arachis duranensis]
MAEFVVLRDSTTHNIILGRKTINALGAVISTKMLRGLGNGSRLRQHSLSLRKKSKEALGVFLTDLDVRVNDKPRPEPEGDLEKFKVGDSEEKFTFVNRNLPHQLKEPLMEMIRANGVLFAWMPADMLGIDPQIMSHHLAIRTEVKPVAQRRRKMSQERAEEVARKTASLLEAGFIRELDYSTWLSNVVLVRKHNGKWRIYRCTGPTRKNGIHNARGYILLQGNAIRAEERGSHLPKVDEQDIFSNLIGKTVEVYVDDILVKTTQPNDLTSDLENVFASLRQQGIKLNPLKYAFAMEAGKFLGFMITQRGVEANPEKCQAILQMKSPGCVKDVQRLAGKLTVISRFLGASAAKALPFFNLMKKGVAFEWTPACEEAFKHFKKILASPPVLGKPKNGEPLYLYLAITDEVMTAVLVREEEKAQQPIYFVSRALQGAELRYSKLERLALALLHSSHRLRQYFQSHKVVVRTDQAIRQVLQKTDLVGRMITWAVELSQYNLQYEPKHAIKAQAMADFLVEITGDPTKAPSTQWKLHVDRASNQMFGGAKIILESPTRVVYEQSIKFEFPVSNNQAEYEALLGGLVLAKEVGATRLEVCSDSQVMTSQINGAYQARDSLLQKYLEKVKELTEQFKEVSVQHVPRKRNMQADLLSKLASTKPGAGNQSLIQGLVREPTITLHITRVGPSWMDPIIDFLESGKLPEDGKSAKTLRREAVKYAITQGHLFKKGLSQPLLKCLHPDQTEYVLQEVHEGCCGHHIRGKALARKLIRAGNYWPSIMKDSKDFVRKCVKCQENANFHRAPAAELSLLMSSRPFSQWGVNLLRAFLVITRFGIPDAVISDNRTQFTDKRFVEFLASLGIKKKFSSVEHPQTNGQVEAANKVILLGLKKRLDKKKGAWADELASVLWSYRTTEQSSTGKPLFD